MSIATSPPDATSPPALTRQHARDLIAAHLSDAAACGDARLIALVQAAYAAGHRAGASSPVAILTRQQAWHCRVMELLTEGYQNRAPTPETGFGDRESCGRCTCNVCGRVGLRYEPFTRRWPDGGRTYRAFAVCPDCGDWGEF